MTTREFINKAFYGNTKSTSCSSVFADGNGDIYSYGYHYPLLFRVNGKVVRNVRGYSNSTAKHIGWTRDIDAIDINTLHTFRLTGNGDEIMERLVFGQKQYIDSLREQMDAKKRKDTQVYHWLEYNYNQAVNALNELQA